VEVIRINERDVVFKEGKHIYCVDRMLFFLIHRQGFGDGIYSAKAFIKKAIIRKFIKRPVNNSHKHSEHDNALNKALKYITKAVKYDSVLGFMLKKAEKEIELGLLLGKKRKHEKDVHIGRM